MNIMKTLLWSAGVFAVANSAMAKEEEIGDDGYTKTYNDESKAFKDRMKEARSQPTIVVANTKGGMTLGLTGDFGPVYDAEPTSSSGMGFGLGVEPGYMIQSETWSRLELGVQLAYHSFAWKSGTGTDATMTPFSVVPRVGFGHSLGNNLFGIVRIGFGFATGQVSAKNTLGTFKTDSKMGFVLSGDYDVTYGDAATQFYGGIGATHYKYSFSKFGDTAVDSTLNMNHVNLHGGVRFKF
jgi:hypothetical protein